MKADMNRRQFLYPSAAFLCISRLMLHLLVTRSAFPTTSSGRLRAIWTFAAAQPLLVTIFAGSLISLLGSSYFLVKSGRGSLFAFLSERESARVLLFTAFFWSVPMVLGGGALLNDDWGPQLRAALIALNSFRAGIIPAWTFVFGNGISYTLQYPPLATLIVAGLAYATHLPVELCFKLTCVLMHGLFITGGYRLARALNLGRLPAAAGVVLISLTQQYWVFFDFGSMPSLIAASLLPIVLFALVRTIQTGTLKFALLLGCSLAWVAMAQPMAGLFTVYTVSLALASLLVFRWRAVFSKLRPLMLSGVVVACVSAPYVISVLVFRKYNRFQAVSLASGFYFPPLVPLRWFWWSPHLGWPPGIGSDSSGYIGIAIAVATLIAIAVALKTPSVTYRLFLGALAWGMILAYGTGLGIYKVIPFGYVAKGSYRLWPLLAIALILGIAIALNWLFSMHRYALASLVIAVGVLESAPFSLKPAFKQSSDSARQVLASIPQNSATFLTFMDGKEDSRPWQDIYHEISLAQHPDLYYIHHEENGIVGKRYWELFDTISRLRPNTDWRKLEAELQWFRVQYLIVVGHSAVDYQSLGPGVTKLVDGVPVAVIPIQVPFPMIRQLNSASIQLSPDDWRSDGSVRLPISFQPFLKVLADRGSLNTKSDNGYLAACCVSSPDVLLRVETALPAWLGWLWALSLVFQFGTVLLLVVLRPSMRFHLRPGEATTGELKLFGR